MVSTSPTAGPGRHDLLWVDAVAAAASATAASASTASASAASATARKRVDHGGWFEGASNVEETADRTGDDVLALFGIAAYRRSSPGRTRRTAVLPYCRTAVLPYRNAGCEREEF